MSVVEFSHPHGRVVDPDEAIPPSSTVSTVEYRGRHRRDKVRKIKRMPQDATLDNVARSLPHPEKVIGVVIGGKDSKGERIEPVTIFFNGHVSTDAGGQVDVPLANRKTARRRFRTGDKIAFPTRPM